MVGIKIFYTFNNLIFYLFYYTFSLYFAHAQIGCSKENNLSELIITGDYTSTSSRSYPIITPSMNITGKGGRTS